MSYIPFSEMGIFLKSGVSCSAVTNYWPPLSFIIKVAIYKSFGFNSGFVTYLDYILSIHLYSLSFFVNLFISSGIYSIHLYRRICQCVYSKKNFEFLNFFEPMKSYRFGDFAYPNSDNYALKFIMHGIPLIVERTLIYQNKWIWLLY